MRCLLVILLATFKVIDGEVACEVCRCTEQHVVCSGQGLTAIPDKIPQDTIVLLLDRNNLHTIHDMTFANLKNLQKLDLSNNHIESLSQRSFNGLNNLQDLNLASNKLMLHPEIFTEKLFRSLQKLNVLWLNDNYVSDPPINATYPDQVLKNLRMLKELHIDGLSCPFGPGFRSLTRLVKLSLFDDSHRCVMQKLTDSTFEYVPNITHLNVSNCEIRDTEPSTFSPLKRIVDLDLSGNPHLGFNRVAKALQGLSGSPIKVLRLNQLHQMPDFCSKLTLNLVRHLENTTLTELYLDSNGMIDLETEAIKKLPKTLEVLSMRDNRFIFTSNWLALIYLTSLQYFDISDLNKWHPIKRDVSSIENKSGFQFPIIPVPPKLETVVISRCYFRGGIKKAIVTKNSVKRITADHSLLAFLNGAIQGLTHLEHLDLSHNVLKNVTTDAFSAIPSLKSLNLSHNDLGQVLRDDTMGNLFGKLKTLEILKIIVNNIQVLPNFIFRGLRDVRVIDLSHNELDEFAVVITHLKKLKYLNLADNKIRYLSSEVMASLDNVTLNLMSNPLSCTCEGLDFLKWMSDHRSHMQHLNRTQCKNSEGRSENLTLIVDIINRLDNRCKDNKDIFISSVCIFLMIIFVMIYLILYRFRWRLRRLYYLGAKGRRQNLDNHFAEYVYDGFVSYADADRNFVIDEMMNELERKAGFKLCIHHRDFIPGSIIASNIVNAIQNSRKTIIILSPSFLKSDWCNYEFNMALTEGVARRENVVVCIMYKSVDFSKLPKTMSAMFVKYSFLQYDMEGSDYRIFWSNICDSIRTPQFE